MELLLLIIDLKKKLMHVSFHLKRKSCAGSFFVKEVSEHVRYSNCPFK